MKALNIKDYIKELLFTNQGVVIPGLGGFVSEYEPAAFDVSENKFLPPSKKISFNAEYSYQDNLLIDFISQKEKIDQEKSKTQLSDFVNDLKSKLKKGEKIEFPEIGTLSQTAKGEIQFKQDTNSNLLTDSFGFQSIKSKPIISEKTVEKVKTHIKPKKSYKKLIIIGSSAIIILCLIGLSWYLTDGYSDFRLISSNDSSVKELVIQEAINNTEKNLDSIAKADSVKALINQSIDENTDLKDALFYEEPEKDDPKPQYSAFHIIAGSFKKMENAEKFSSELKNKGYEPEIIQSGENLIRIAIFSFTDETEALKELYKLRQDSNIKSVWILKSI